MPLYFGNSGKYVISFNGSQARAIMITRPEPDIPDTPTGIYDDEFPISWNSLAVVEAGNVVAGQATGNFKLIKVSNLTPAIEELQSAQLTLVSVADVYTLPFVESEQLSDSVLQVVYADGFAFIIYRVSEPTELDGIHFPESGLYVNDFYTMAGENVDVTLSLAQSVYDDTFPIEWSMADLGNNAMVELDIPYYKVTNLSFTAEELSAIECTISVNGNDYVQAIVEPEELEGTVLDVIVEMIPNSQGDDKLVGVYIISVPHELAGVEIEDGFAFPEGGTYVALAMNETDYPEEAFSFSLNLAQSATQYLYGHVAPSTVSYNGVTLPDIESVWDKETYPYALILSMIMMPGVYSAMFSTSELYFDGVDIRIKNAGVFNGANCGVIFGDDWVTFGAPEEFEANELMASADALDGAFMWTSHDILNTDGTTYLSASDPVKSYPDADVIIDGVGYKGAVLPKLPERDKTVYPYAVINSTTAYGYTRATLRYYRNVFVAHDENYSSDNWSLLVNGDDYMESTISFKTADGCSDSAWSKLTTKKLNNVVGYVDVDGVSTPYKMRLCNYDSDYVKWSNHSFNGANGEEWITATDPILITGSPIGYSYGGIIHPALPVVDGYDYAYIGVVNGIEALTLTTTPTMLEKSGSHLSDTHAEAYDFITYVHDKTNNRWSEFTSGSKSAGEYVSFSRDFEITWSNHDVMDYNDNTVIVLSASNPILCYTS